MTTGLKKGDKAKVTDASDMWHSFEVGEVVEYYGADCGYYGFKRTEEGGLCQILKPHHFEKIEEESTMTEKRSNPKNFRNGDVIKVSGNSAPGTRDIKEVVFVKFGENYYNLTAGGQMKACRYLPPGTKEIITNLSGMGKFFLMSEEELEEATTQEIDPFGPSGGGVTDTDNNERIKEILRDYETFFKQPTYTTEEK